MDIVFGETLFVYERRIGKKILEGKWSPRSRKLSLERS